MTAAELIEVWSDRDRRYASLRHPLPSESIEAAREYRQGELDRVRAGERSVAWHWLRGWEPPAPFGRF